MEDAEAVQKPGEGDARHDHLQLRQWGFTYSIILARLSPVASQQKSAVAGKGSPSIVTDSYPDPKLAQTA
jgi:hypothetical protein